MSSFLVSVLLGTCLWLLSWTVTTILYHLWWRPWKLEAALRQQGIHGPPRHFLHGNMKEFSRLSKEARSKPMNLCHRILPRVLPLHQSSLEKYGKHFVLWYGRAPRVNIMDPELIREILSNKFGHFEKPKMNPLTKMLATGLATYEGEKWAMHRRIITPAFHVEKIRGMLSPFSISWNALIQRWEESVEMAQGLCEVDVWQEFQTVTADVISRTAFGSNYKEGNRIFELQTEQASLVTEAITSLYLPGFRFLPTRKNRRRREIDREVRAVLTGIIKKREEAIRAGVSTTNDLLSLLIRSNLKECEEQGSLRGMTTEDVLQECKLFYFAGQETTSVLLTWTIILLCMHPVWQTRAREEVLQVFGKKQPDFDGLSQLKTVAMVLYEVLRLYPPLMTVIRAADKDMKIGGFRFPVGIHLSVSILSLHHDREIWGDDVEDFKPERFSEGISKASNNQLAFLPFGWGPRICVGQNFALIEAKLALSLMLQHFSFELSPAYTHAPHWVVTLQPQHGAQILVRKL